MCVLMVLMCVHAWWRMLMMLMGADGFGRCSCVLEDADAVGGGCWFVVLVGADGAGAGGC